jgi:hypothetical protein
MIFELRLMMGEVKSWRRKPTSKIKIQQSSLVNQSFQPDGAD